MLEGYEHIRGKRAIVWKFEKSKRYQDLIWDRRNRTPWKIVSSPNEEQEGLNISKELAKNML